MRRDYLLKEEEGKREAQEARGLGDVYKRQTSEGAAGGGRATLIRINPRDTDVPSGHLSISLGAEEGIRNVTELARA